ncbi:MAG TPA: protein-disulfide reductase DsbD N-terminal domain-containing protein [Pseudomonadales bacterium]
MRASVAVLASFLTGLAGVAHAAELATGTLLDSGPSLTRASGGGALPADEAFALSTVVEADGDVILLWEMPPSYYLYRKSLQLAHGDHDLLPALELPDGTQVSDEFFGESEVYFERLLARLPADAVDAAAGATLDLQLSYQGCREDVYCYPPQQKVVSVTLP